MMNGDTSSIPPLELSSSMPVSFQHLVWEADWDRWRECRTKVCSIIPILPSCSFCSTTRASSSTIFARSCRRFLEYPNGRKSSVHFSAWCLLVLRIAQIEVCLDICSPFAKLPYMLTWQLFVAALVIISTTELWRPHSFLNASKCIISNETTIVFRHPMSRPNGGCSSSVEQR